MTNNQGKNYDLIASGFSEMRNSFSTEQKYVDLFMKYLSPEAHILDVGCGSGYRGVLSSHHKMPE